MSLLTQFYPGPGGGSSFSAGGVTSTANGSAVVVTGPGGSASVNTGGVSGGVWRLTAGGAHLTSSTSYTPILYEANSANPATSITASAPYPSPVYLINMGDATGVGGAGGMTLNLSNISTLYGGYSNVSSGNGLTITGGELTSIVGFWSLNETTNNTTINAAKLVDTTQSVFLKSNSGSLNFSGTVLNTASVDKILSDLVKWTSPGVGATINLSGGCAPPSAAGLVNKGLLQAFGYTILNN